MLNVVPRGEADEREARLDGQIDGEGAGLLDAAREVAHHTMRPGAPLSTYLIGVAMGRGMPLAEAIRAVTAAAHRHGTAPPAA